MGSPRKQRKKYSTPSHPWQKERILSEKEILKEFGLRRKYEIWKMNSILKNFSNQAKKLITEKTGQVEIDRNHLLKKLNSLGLLDKNTKIADVLSITLNDILERRLQTLVYKKNLSRSITQARQFITHKHIMVADKLITTPSYLVHVEEERNIQFVPLSSLSDPAHPERFIEEKNVKGLEINTEEKVVEEKKEKETKNAKIEKEKKPKVKKTSKKENTEEKKPKEDNKQEETK